MDIMAYMKRQNYQYLNSGADGYLFINKHSVIKMLDGSPEMDCYDMDEASIAYYVLQHKPAYQDILPAYNYVGVFKHTPCIIRDDIEDINIKMKYHQTFSPFIKRFLNKAIYADDIIELDKDECLTQWGKTGIPEDIISFDEIHELITGLYAMIDDGILPEDIHIENIGRNQEGQLKIRDLGRFFITENNEILWSIYQNQSYNIHKLEKHMDKQKLII